jgi:tetratricopeptide (TPR) repeat protein
MGKKSRFAVEKPASAGPVPRRGVSMILAILLPFAAASAGSRTALVIGNDRYEPAAGSLRNSGNDARAVGKALKALGFAVIERHDIGRDQLLKAMSDFRKTLPGSEVALFYYAGHGLSLDGANYLVPIKSGFQNDVVDDVALRLEAETHLVNAEQVVADMNSAGAGCNIIILDACRNTPLARRAATRALATRGGLAEMTPPAGSLIAFATDAGRVAFDGDGANGLYTEELLKHLLTPGLTIEQVFKRTRAGVLKRSDGGQLPAEYSRLVGEDIYLAGPAPEPPPRVIAAASPSPEPVADPMALAKAGRTKETLAMLRASPTGPEKPDAAAAIGILLEKVKDDLKDAKGPSSRVVLAESSCALIIEALPDLVTGDDSRNADLSAKAHNRRGDALLLLGRPREALAQFDLAQPLAPDDPYILFNRGRAHLALGEKDAARADFTAAADPKFDRPVARKLASDALSGLK